MRKLSRDRAGVPIVGMDLSLRGSAVVSLPSGWSPRAPWRGVKTMTSGVAASKHDYRAQAMRLDTIVDAIEDFMAKRTAEERLPWSVHVEDYAYGLAANGGIMIAELGGAVKRMMYEQFNVVVVPVNNMTARKYLLGKLPTGKGAAVLATHAAVRSMRPTCFSDFNKGADEADAWVVANYARTLLNLPGVSLG